MYPQCFLTLKTPSLGNFGPQNPLLRPFLATPLAYTTHQRQGTCRHLTSLQGYNFTHGSIMLVHNYYKNEHSLISYYHLIHIHFVCTSFIHISKYWKSFINYLSVVFCFHVIVLRVAFVVKLHQNWASPPGGPETMETSTDTVAKVTPSVKIFIRKLYKITTNCHHGYVKWHLMKKCS